MNPGVGWAHPPNVKSWSTAASHLSCFLSVLITPFKNTPHICLDFHVFILFPFMHLANLFFMWRQYFFFFLVLNFLFCAVFLLPFLHLVLFFKLSFILKTLLFSYFTIFFYTHLVWTFSLLRNHFRCLILCFSPSIMFFPTQSPLEFT